MSYTDKDHEFLFQKLGETWYIFAEIEGEVVYSALPDGMDPHTTRIELYEVIEDHLTKVAKAQKTGQSAA